MEDGSSEINECDLLYCLLTHSKDGALFAELPQEERLALSDAASLLANYLAPGVRIKDCVTAFKVSQLNGGAAINPFLFESFRQPLGELIDGLPDGAALGWSFWQRIAARTAATAARTDAFLCAKRAFFGQRRGNRAACARSV